MRIALVSVLCVTAAVVAANAQIDTGQPLLPQQQLIPNDGFPASEAANYQAWMNYLVVRSWVETPASTGSINIGCCPSSSRRPPFNVAARVPALA